MTNIEVMTVLAALVGVGYAAGRLGYMGARV